MPVPDIGTPGWERVTAPSARPESEGFRVPSPASTARVRALRLLVFVPVFPFEDATGTGSPHPFPTVISASFSVGP